MTDMTESEGSPAAPENRGKTWTSRLFRLVTWLVALGCFYLVYTKIEGAAAREGTTALGYLGNFFAEADWTLWLALMIPYSCFFFLVDAHATWRVIKWYNAPPIKYTNVLPIRASAYVLSLVNEQVSKGAISLYLLRKYQVPVWQAISTMILMGMVEIYQLLVFSAIGAFFYWDTVLLADAQSELPLVQILLSVYAGAFLYFPLQVLYFRGYLLKGSTLREKPLLRAFRLAKVTDYFLVLLFKAPNLLAAVGVYTGALALFNVDVGFGVMLALLPLIFLAAALPLPFHAGALVLWTVLFPNFPEVGAFSLVMHTFFVIFNAVIGVVFLPKANKELFVDDRLDINAMSDEAAQSPDRA